MSRTTSPLGTIVLIAVLTFAAYGPSRAQVVQHRPVQVRASTFTDDGQQFALMYHTSPHFGFYDPFLITSTDDGWTWHNQPSENLGDAYSLSSVGNVMLSAPRDGMVSVSFDKCATWTQLPEPAQYEATDYVTEIIPLRDEHSFLLHRSQDGMSVLWRYDLESGLWSGPFRFEGQMVLVRELSDGRIAVRDYYRKNLISVGDLGITPWEYISLTSLPGGRVPEDMYVADGRLIIQDEQDGAWLYNNGAPILLADVAKDKITAITNEIVHCFTHWYYRSDPYTLHTYDEVSTMNAPLPVWVGTIHSQLIATAGGARYKVVGGSPFWLEQQWIWGASTDTDFEFTLNADGNVVSTVSLRDDNGHASISFDGGYSFHSAVFDDPCASQRYGFIRVLADGRVWALDEFGCNYVSHDGGLTYTRLPDFGKWTGGTGIFGFTEMNVFKDGSFSGVASLGSGLNRIVRGTDIEDRDVELIDARSYRYVSDSHVGLIAKYSGAPFDPILEVSEDGKNYALLFTMPEAISELTWVDVQLIGDNEIIVYSSNTGSSSPHKTLIRLIDATTKTYRTLGPFNFGILKMTRLPSGQLLAVRADLTFQIFDHNDQPSTIYADPQFQRLSGVYERDGVLAVRDSIVMFSQKGRLELVMTGFPWSALKKDSVEDDDDGRTDEDSVVSEKPRSSRYTPSPNPATDLITIPDVPPHATMVITTADGIEVFNAHEFSGDVLLNTSSLPAGSYFVRVASDTDTYTLPIQILR